MVIRQLKAHDYNSLLRGLNERAQAMPLDAAYTVFMTVDRVEYLVRVQPEEPRKIAVLQALQVVREPEGPFFTLITENAILSALLELLIAQGVRIP